MSEERNNVEVIPEFKMYITDLETKRKSKEINVSDLIFNDYIEFEFGDYEDEDYETLPYKDFKFFINNYSVTFYSPQMKDLQQKVEQLENIIDVKKYDYDYLETLFSKSSKEEVLKAYTYKCEQLEKVMKAQNEFEMKAMQLENIRKEAIKLLKKCGIVDEKGNFNAYLDTIELKDLLNILNKGSEE